VRGRGAPRVVALLAAPEPTEALLVWLVLYTLAYELAGDAPAKALPRSIGFLSALVMAVATQVRAPALAAAFADALKPVWAAAEAFLFVLTGVVVRGAFDGATPALSGGFLGVLVVGALARLGGDVVVGAAWVAVEGAAAHGGGARGAVAALRAAPPRLVAERVALVWSTTLPKATLQASLGPKPLLEAAALGISVPAATFIAQSAAVSILFAATLGSLLTFSVGAHVARKLEDAAAAADASVGGAAARAAAAGTGAAELLLDGSDGSNSSAPNL